MLTLYPEQRAHYELLRKALHTHRAALDTSVTGAGKTVVAVELAKDFDGSVLVICPKAVIPSWERTFKEQKVKYLDILNYEKLRAGNTDWGYFSPAMFGGNKRRKKSTKFNWGLTSENTLIIWDECHYLKGLDSQNSRMAQHAKKFHNLMLSATAAESPVDMKTTGYLLGLHNLTNFMAWARVHGCGLDNWKNLHFRKTDAKENLAKINAQLYPERASRITREQMAHYFGDNLVITDPIDFGDNGGIEACYAEMQDQLDNLREIASNDPVNPLTIQLRQRQNIELVKIPALNTLINDYLDEGMSVVVFLNFKDSIRSLRDKRKDWTPVIWGENKGTERQDAIDMFQNDECRVLICQTASGGVGVNLHDQFNGTYPRISLINPGWSAKDLVQAMGRTDRAGKKTPTIQRILFAAHSIEEDIAKKVRVKLDHIEQLNDFDLIDENIQKQLFTAREDS